MLTPRKPPPPHAPASSKSAAGRRFASFREFYPFYLQEHANRICRRLHFIGNTLVIGCLVALSVTRDAGWIAAALVCGYGFAWLGHFFFEHNRPATFRHPVYSLMGDWVMYADMLRGRITF